MTGLLAALTDAKTLLLKSMSLGENQNECLWYLDRCLTHRLRKHDRFLLSESTAK